jgi:hypothetical protein
VPTERAKTLQFYLSLAMLIVSVASTILIPVWTFFISPEPFTGDFQIESVVAPAAFFPGRKAATQSGNRTPDEPIKLMTLKIQNNGPAARHNVSLRVFPVRQFTGVGVTSTPTSLLNGAQWRTPTFLKDQSALEFQAIAELPVNGLIQVSIWGNFDDLFRSVGVRSSEGAARVQEGTAVYGWSLWFISNLWWVATLLSLALVIVLLRRFESKRKS